MKARRTLRRRIVLVAVAVAFSFAALLSLLAGLARLRGVDRSHSELQEMHRGLVKYIARMRHEVTLLELGAESASAERLQGLAEECSEAFQNLEEGFGSALDGRPGYEQMKEEWGELTPMQTNNGWARYATDLDAFEGHLHSVREGLEDTLALARQTALVFCNAGVAATSIALVLSLWVLLTILSDVASDSYEPEGLEGEVAALAQDSQFETHVQLLLPPEEREHVHHDWELRVTRRFPEQRTHVCFEALASRNGTQVKLWGRRYKWAGYAKSFQRIFLPAFNEATWRALCLMHTNGLGAPVPVVHKHLHAGPFKAGAIILMEHVGEVQSVKQFLKSGFCLLPREDQDALLQRLVSFLRSLHDLGIYGIKPRYLHGKRLEDPDRMQLYLFDLDKLLLWTGCPGLIAGRLRGKDHRRLVQQVEPVLSHARRSELQRWLKTPPPASGAPEV